MHRRTRISLLIAAVVLVVFGALLLLRMHAPPEVARLLPESDGILYVNFRPVRSVLHFDQHPVRREGAYQEFVDQTGIVFERDLNEAAVAIHHMPDPRGPNGPAAFSEVLAGRLDTKRLARYLGQRSTRREHYAGQEIYCLESQGRTVRVALVGYDTVAVSNTPTPEQIHSMLDRYRTAALPFAGSSVLSEYYKLVPALSFAWGIGKISLPFWSGGGPSILGVRLPISPDTAFIASVRWLGALHLRVEEIAPDPAAAEAAANTATGMVALLTVGADSLAPEGAAPDDLRKAFGSIKVSHSGSMAELNATIPVSLVQALASTSTSTGARVGGAVSSPAP